MSDCEEGSLDFSLRMKHGSEGSHDSFYMDFDRGIDSDIEALPDAATAAEAESGLTESAEEEARDAENDDRWLKDKGQVDTYQSLLMNPATAGIIDEHLKRKQPKVPCTSLNLNGYIPLKDLRSFEDASFNENCGMQDKGENLSTNDKRDKSINVQDIIIHRLDTEEILRKEWKRKSKDTLIKVFSAIYGKLLVVMGMAFPMAEVISPHIAPSFYDVLILKYKNIARFGLMHMIAANLCVWLSVLIQESKHEVLNLNYRPPESASYTNENSSLHFHRQQALSDNHTHHVIVRRSMHTPEYVYYCKQSNLLGELVNSASPFLFPCTIEYSLICAAILYVMWKNIGCNNMKNDARINAERLEKRSRHHYSVDCAGAHKGLFLGILMVVLTSISLILFFVYIDRYSYYHNAVLMSQISELILYTMSSLAIAVGMIRMRRMAFFAGSNMELDSILLVISQTGLYIYTIFKVIGAYFMAERSSAIILITGLAMLLQGTMQTVFILHAIRRCISSVRQYEEKPGREAVTFLLVANLAMWAINTFETSRSNVHPLQLEFYGKLGWTLITHISMPLAIFYRFHSTVCLCEIWTRAYKIQPTSL